jgi:uncharacterized protein YgbK (DUF1537 family)
MDPAQAIDFVFGRPSQPLVYSTATPAAVADLQKAHGAAKVAEAIEHFFAGVARGLVERGVKRLVVAGGETSGAVVSALGLASLEIGPEIDPGVPALFSREGAGLGLALKSGNFGGIGFFERALAVLERGS